MRAAEIYRTRLCRYLCLYRKYDRYFLWQRAKGHVTVESAYLNPLKYQKIDNKLNDALQKREAPLPPPVDRLQ